MITADSLNTDSILLETGSYEKKEFYMDYSCVDNVSRAAECSSQAQRNFYENPFAQWAYFAVSGDERPADGFDVRGSPHRNEFPQA